LTESINPYVDQVGLSGQHGDPCEPLAALEGPVVNRFEQLGKLEGINHTTTAKCLRFNYV
jgi:hypothetical protein